MPEWNPENIFHKKCDGVYNGVRFVQNAIECLGDVGKRVVTSRDPGMQEVQDLLLRPNMPDGIKKWQLPIVISEGRPSFAFITLCSPKAHTPMHMHPDDAIIRVIMSGSITIKCKDPDRCVELTHGDWMYVPNTVPYSYTAGPLGASIFHMYNCGGGDDDITTDYWKIHGFPGGGLKIFNGLPKSEVPKDWFENSN